MTDGTWGDRSTSKDYEMMMQGGTAIARPVSLVGHAMTGFQQNLSDPVVQVYVRKEQGRIRTYERVIRNAEMRSQTATVNFGATMWTQLLHRARQGNCVQTTLFAKRLCPTRPEYAHAYVFPNVTFNPPTRVNDFITIDDEVAADMQSEIRMERELILYAVGGFEVADLTPPLYGVAFLGEDCACGQDTTYARIIAVGGSGGGGDPLYIVKTDDRFATNDEPSNSAPNGSIGRGVWAEGNQVLIAFSDASGVATGTAGGTLFSGDGGDTWAIDVDLTLPIYGVTKLGDYYIAVGGAGAGAAQIFTSLDGLNWDTVASAALPATSALTSCDVDKTHQELYAVGEGGTALKAILSAGSLLVSALTPPGAPGQLNSVRVLAPQHISIDGASGYHAESLDGGTTWVQPSVSGTDALWCGGGSPERTFIGAANKIKIRSVLDDNDFVDVAMQGGATIGGQVQAVAVPEGEANYAVFVTNTGEVIFVKPFYPGA